MIAAGPRRWSPRGRRVVAVVVAAVLLVGVAVWYADTRRRDHEFALLLGCATSAENARVAAERRVAAMASYVRPSLAVFSEPDRQLYPLIAHEAVAAQPDLQAAVRRCDDVQVWRLHSDLTAARASYLVYLGTETSRLGAIAADGRPQGSQRTVGTRHRAGRVRCVRR